MGWTLSGNLAYAACQWGMLVILAKTVSPGMVGQFGLGLAIATPVLLFTNLQLRSLQAIGFSGRFELSDFLGVRILASGAGLLTILAIAVVSRNSTETTAVIVAVGVWKCIEAIEDTLYGQLQAAERMRDIAISQMLKGPLSLVLMFVVMGAFHSVLVGAFALATGALVTLLGFDAHRAARVAGTEPESAVESVGARLVALVPRWHTVSVQRIAKLGLPLGVTSLLLAITNNVPRYFLQHWGGETSLGYFTALAYPTAAFSIFLSAMGQAATPRMAAYFKSDRRGFYRLVLTLMAVPLGTLAVLGPASMIFGSEILSVLYRPDYGQYRDAFVLLTLGGAVWGLASVLGYAATASGRLRGQAAAAAVIAVASILAGAIAVPTFGIIGAAITTIASGAVAVSAYALLFRVTPEDREP